MESAGGEHIYRSLIEGAGDLVVAFDDSGTIAFANAASIDVVGRPPEELAGRNVFDFMHPDDMDRALRALALNVEFGSAPGTTNFRLLHADGTWVPVDMTGGHATDDGERTLYSSFSRVAEDREAMSQTLLRLLDGAPLTEALRPVLDTFAWRSNGSEIGISFVDGRGTRGAVSTGIDLDLVGGHDDPSTPWGEVRRTGMGTTDLDLSSLDDGRRAAAEAAGMGAYWIDPITSPAGEPALLTVWTKAGSRPPSNHALAAEASHAVVEVILRWAEQQRRLDHAAFHDPLTGLANRAAFFFALESGRAGGAVLYCDLDRFKPVNDQFGHAAGDEVLVAVAGRLRACVRSADVVARLGGDEFAVLCPGASLAIAGEIAARIKASISGPFHLRGTDEKVQIGISVGLAHDPDRLTEALLESADHALYTDKTNRRAGR